MVRRPPRSTRTDTLVRYTTLFRSEKGLFSAVIHVTQGDTHEPQVPTMCTGHRRHPVRQCLFPALWPVGQRGARTRDQHRGRRRLPDRIAGRSEEHTSELQSLMRISYSVFCLTNKTQSITPNI